MTEIGVSTWSLHRELGRFWADDRPGAGRASSQRAVAGLPLIELPGELRRRGYGMVQLCHFHLPEVSEEYLAALRGELHRHDVRLDALLIDDGDLTAADADVHEEWISGWLRVAETLGAARARVIGGMAAPTASAVVEAADRLRRLALAHPAVRVVTENWFDLLSTPEAVVAFLERAEGAVGLLVDLENWAGDDVDERLARIAPLAETCHAKADAGDSGIDAARFRRRLETIRDAGYQGPLALVYDGPDPAEWEALAREAEIARGVFGASR